MGNSGYQASMLNNIIGIKAMIGFISKLLVSSIVIFILLLSSIGFAEDIELYLSEAVLQNDIKPKVLIIFDNSGSMSRVEENSKAAYDPNIVYGGPLADNEIEYIYYTKAGDSIADITSLDDSRRFIASINGCSSANTALATAGSYSDNVRHYKYYNGNGKWRALPETNGNNINVLDCKNDYTLSDNNNAKDKDGNTLPSG